MRLTRVFLDTDLRCAFEGLRAVAKQAKTDLDGSTVIFMNRRATAFKMMHKNSYLVYYKNDDKRIPLDALRHLPEHFGGTEMEMNSAIRKTIMEKLKIDIKVTG